MSTMMSTMMPTMMPTTFELYMLRGPAPTAVYPLVEKSVTVGRDPLSSIVINDPEVSRQHALIFRAPSGIFQIQDLGSTNGTYVDGKRLGSEALSLQPLNVITMGGAVTLVFREGTHTDQGEEQVQSEISEAGDSEAGAIPARDYGGSSEPQEAKETGEKISREDVEESAPLPAIEETILPLDQPQHAPKIEGLECGDPLATVQSEDDESKELSPNVILGLVLLLLCCCLTLLVFLIYLGGDWYLRELGLVP